MGETMGKKFMMVGGMQALLAAHPPGALVAVTGWRDRFYANIKLQETTVPTVADHVGWDYDLYESASGQPIIVIEADNPY